MYCRIPYINILINWSTLGGVVLILFIKLKMESNIDDVHRKKTESNTSGELH